MSDEQADQLLRKIIAAARVPDDAVDIDRAYEHLDEYVERELAGEPVADLLPEVAYFIATDPEFAALYASLRELAASFDPADLPDVTLDVARVEARLGRTIALSPQDVVRPAPEPPGRPDPQRLLALLPTWSATLPRPFGVFMSGGVEREETLPLPGQPVETTLQIVASQSDDRQEIDGRVTPARDDLVGQMVQLYRIHLDPQPSVELVAERPVDRFGRFAFTDLAFEVYVLALAVGAEVVGVAWLDLDQGGGDGS